MHISIAVSGDEKVTNAELEYLARQTGIPCLTANIAPDYLLYKTPDHLEIRSNKSNVSIHTDFLSGKLQHRRLQGGGKGQDIAKAVGLKNNLALSVLDTTAGMGNDSFVLATLGCKVTLIERTPAIHALLMDAIQRVQQSDNTEVKDIIARMHLIQGDAISFLTALDSEQKPDVIYLDPMFPERKKSAQVKKEMQFFHDLVGSDLDAHELLKTARKRATKRIVVKRPRLSPRLDEQSPQFIITGKSIRYDVYLPEK
jgi:16S rRNA (guanine1516-N2)-methyltransferase